MDLDKVVFVDADQIIHTGLNELPIDHYLHGAADDVEEIAYTFIAKQVDSVVSGISRQFLSARKKGVRQARSTRSGSEEAGEVHSL
jgi:hypothetical protein